MSEPVSEASKRRAQAAKSYIENMLKLQHRNRQDRLDRYATGAVLPYLCL